MTLFPQPTNSLEVPVSRQDRRVKVPAATVWWWSRRDRGNTLTAVRVFFKPVTLFSFLLKGGLLGHNHCSPSFISHTIISREVSRVTDRCSTIDRPYHRSVHGNRRGGSRPLVVWVSMLIPPRNNSMCTQPQKASHRRFLLTVWSVISKQDQSTLILI